MKPKTRPKYVDGRLRRCPDCAETLGCVENLQDGNWVWICPNNDCRVMFIIQSPTFHIVQHLEPGEEKLVG